MILLFVLIMINCLYNLIFLTVFHLTECKEGILGCANCGKDHAACSRKCPELSKPTKIRSYASAISSGEFYHQPNPIPSHGRSRENPNATKDKTQRPSRCKNNSSTLASNSAPWPQLFTSQWRKLNPILTTR
jgi:hypothetical protein